MKPTIAAIIITKNEEAMLANCVETLRWCDEIIVVDTGSDDKTVALAHQLDAQVVSFPSHSFAETRTMAIHVAKTDWIIYIDADERVTPNLAKEIQVQAETTTANALSCWRENMMYGQVFHHGGWEKDLVTRAFRRSALQDWQGDVHETPRFSGEVVRLHAYLLHLTHRNTVDGLKKTISWTPIEARLLFEAGEPPVKLRTIFRKGVMEMIRRGVLKRGSRDGMAGWVEAVVQGMNRMLVYIQVWELQQKPPLAERYQAREREIAAMWKKTS